MLELTAETTCWIRCGEVYMILHDFVQAHPFFIFKRFTPTAAPFRDRSLAHLRCRLRRALMSRQCRRTVVVVIHAKPRTTSGLAVKVQMINAKKGTLIAWWLPAHKEKSMARAWTIKYLQPSRVPWRRIALPPSAMGIARWPDAIASTMSAVCHQLMMSPCPIHWKVSKRPCVQ